MSKTEHKAVKKLSPSEPKLVINLTLDTPWNVPITKIDKHVKDVYRLKTSILTPYTLRITYILPLKLYLEALRKLELLLGDLNNILGGKGTICIDVYVSLRTRECICDNNYYSNRLQIARSRKIRNRVFCLALDKVKSTLLYMYCIIGKRTIVRFPTTNTIFDPVQAPKSLFIKCYQPGYPPDKIVEQVKQKIEILINILTSDERPIH